MKKLIVSGSILLSSHTAQSSLPLPPQDITCFKEIAVQYPYNLPALLSSLSPEERIFCYYMFRAALPGNLIMADQMHRTSLEVTGLFEFILMHKGKLNQQEFQELESFIADVKIFLVYLWTNQGQYFKKEFGPNKRTPKSIGLYHLTQDKLLQVLKRLGYQDAEQTVIRLASIIFDDTFEPTTTVPANIEQSAVNIYSSDFTQQDYQKLSSEQNSQLNAYFYIEHKDGKRTPKTIAYSTQGKYAQELAITNCWLEKALEHTRKYPQYFDEHLVKSLDLLIQFFNTGDEEFFKQHSNEWRQINSPKVDYTMGFIEVYRDPQETRGFYQAEATIKCLNLEELCSILPHIELKLPVAKEFKRDNLDAGTAPLPNASINQQIFGTGDLGPLKFTAAYCLPNYEDLRELGSKQIMYPAYKSLGTFLNPNLSKKLNYLPEQVEWLKKHDPEDKLGLDLWDVQCILHETIGHASGKLADHTFKLGQELSFNGHTYRVGDTIPVTHDNIKILLSGYASTLEELRAEIIALYVSINHIDELNTKGIFKDWLLKINKRELIEWLILSMAYHGLQRLTMQPSEATEISGDHARANYAIMNYLIDNGGLEFIKDIVTHEDTQYHIIGLRIKDFDRAVNLVTELLQKVQQIKSTGDTLAARDLINTYGVKIRDLEHVTIIKNNTKTLAGDIKALAYIYPLLEPVKDETGVIQEVQAYWPKDVFEQHLTYKKLALSNE